MKTRLLLIRHGQSVGNHKKIFQGHMDLSLSELGKEQALRVAKHLSTLRPDAIYSSDLKRALDTAAPTAAFWHMPIHKREGLREIDSGDWSGLPHATIAERYADSWKSFRFGDDPDRIRCDGGESVAELAERATREILLLGERHAGETVFVFTHATTIRALVYRLGYHPQFCKIPAPTNASVSEFSYEHGVLTLIAYSQDQHMATLSSGSVLE